MEDREISGGAPLRKKLNQEAWEAGKKACSEGRARIEHPRYPKRSLIADWESGWDAERMAEMQAAAQAAVQEAAFQNARTRVMSDGPSQVRAPSPKEVHPRTFWPEGQEMPRFYEKRPYYPCPNCRRVLDEQAGQAVAVLCTANGKAYLRCRCCETRFQMEMR